MATKKPVKKAPVKKPVAKAATPVKKAVKPAAKVVKKAAVKPVKKAAPVKKAVKPIAKVVKKVAVKTVTKSVPAKPNKVVAKSVTKKIAPVPSKKPTIKQAPIPQKPAAPVKKVEVKAVNKVEEKKQGIKAIAANPKDIKIPAPKAVVVPKINTKTSRAYKPDFTKSVLDQLKNNPSSPTNRYSDAELLEFKELVQRKLETAKKELHYLQGLITRKDDMGGDESENRYMTMEDGSLSMEREQLSQMASRQITFIDHLEKALMRIENKTYGICRVTGKLIDKARLRAVPHATLSIEAKMGMTK